jgi:acetyl esterase/lipase
MSLAPHAGLLALSLCCAACGHVDPAALLNAYVPPADHKLSYGPGSLQFGELRLPQTGAPHAAVVLVHGGCWADHLPGLDPRATTFELLRPLAAALTRAGFATWNVEYRRAGSPGGGWPGTFQDLGSATDFLRSVAAPYHLNLDRIIVVGHSSGGQLALWIAARPKLPESSPLYTKNPLRVTAVVDVDGPFDLAAAQPLERDICGIPAISEFLGGTPAEQPERYRDGSALSFLPLRLPQHVFSSALLKLAPDLIASYQAQAKAKGDRITVHNMVGSRHFDMLSPASVYGQALIQVIASLRN